ncbi:Cyanovirin-N [Xylariaceae sp. FL0016]|nr:Cyanovirin-N [Xylariaceae sp. FL0016]
MRSPSHLLPILPILPFLARAAVAQDPSGGFYAACASWQLGFRGVDRFLVSTCPAGDGAAVRSALDLNDCLGNSEGAITAQRVGFAFNSCWGCSASNTSAELTCDCRTSGDKTKTSTIDLDTVISNDDGILGCFDLPGEQKLLVVSIE